MNDNTCPDPYASTDNDYSTTVTKVPVRKNIEFYCEHVIGSRTGVLAAAFHHPSDGRHERFYQWPGEKDKWIKDMSHWQALGYDCYVCPALRYTWRRRQGDALPPTMVWADVDHDRPLPDEDDLLVVNSGTPGHRHVYRLLDRPVDLGTWQREIERFRTETGGDAKIADCDLLRVPGTQNFKTDPPTPVRLLSAAIVPTRHAVMAPTPPSGPVGPARVTSAAGANSAPIPRETPPEPLPWRVGAQLKVDRGEGMRSDDHHALVGACKDSGLTIGQTASVADGYAPSVTKYGALLDKEIRRTWGKLDDGLYHGSEDDALDWALLKRGQGLRAPEDDTTDDDAFWSARPVFKHIEQFARARLVFPYPVLAHVLLRVMASIGPEVKLPAIVGGRGTLNLFVAVVGDPAAGKGGSRQVAEEAVRVDFPADAVLNPGTGEGIASAFVRAGGKTTVDGVETTDVVRLRYRAIFHAPEVSQLEALGNRGGATIIGELNKVYSGEALGFQNRSKETRLPVAKHSYRACLSVDVQPKKANVLLDNEATGFPQRFLFVNAEDKGMPDEDVPEPAPLEWRVPDELKAHKLVSNDIEMKVCQRAINETRAARRASIRGEQPHTHGWQTRLKIAAALAILDERCAVNDEDWFLAGLLLAMSQRVYEGLRAVKQQAEHQANVARGKGEAVRETVKEDEFVSRVAKKIIEKLTDEWVTSAAIRKNLSRKDREYFDDAMTRLVDSGLVMRGSAPNQNGIVGDRYRAVGRP